MSSWLSPKVEKRDSAIHGRGLFTRKPLSTGEIVAVKGGIIVDRTGFQAVRQEISPAEIQIEDDLYIIPVAPADIESNMLNLNHSCEPNVGVRGQITFVAMSEISPDTELTIDYAMIDGDPEERMPCACGSALCRSIVTGDDWRIESLRDRYRGFFSRYLQARIDRHESASSGNQ